MVLPISLPIDEVVMKFKTLKASLEAYYNYKLTGIHLHIHTWADPFERCSCEIMVHVKPVYVTINFSTFRDNSIEELKEIVKKEVLEEIRSQQSQVSLEKSDMDKLVKFLNKVGGLDE